MDKETAVKLIQKWATSHINDRCAKADATAEAKKLTQVVEFVDPGNKTQTTKEKK